MISAKIVKGKKIAGYALEDDITNAGAIQICLQLWMVKSLQLRTIDMGPWMKKTLEVLYNE